MRACSVCIVLLMRPADSTLIRSFLLRPMKGRLVGFHDERSPCLECCSGAVNVFDGAVVCTPCVGRDLALHIATLGVVMEFDERVLTNQIVQVLRTIDTVTSRRDRRADKFCCDIR